MRPPRRGYASSSESKASDRASISTGPLRCAPRPTKLCVSANISSLRASLRITDDANTLTPSAVGGRDDQAIIHACLPVDTRSPSVSRTPHDACGPEQHADRRRQHGTTERQSTHRFDGIAHRLMLDDWLNPVWELVEGHKAAAEEHQHPPYDLGALHDDGVRGVRAIPMAIGYRRASVRG